MAGASGWFSAVARRTFTSVRGGGAVAAEPSTSDVCTTRGEHTASSLTPRSETPPRVGAGCPQCERARLRVLVVSARIVRMSEGGVAAAVAQLRAGVDALLGAPVEGLAATDLAAVLEAVEVQRRRLE